jgi:hypothetical protein
MGLFSLFTGDWSAFKPPKPPKPEYYAPPPPVYVPPATPPTVNETAVQQAPALNAVTPISPILAGLPRNVISSPTTAGLPEEDDVLRALRSRSGGMSV